MTRQNKIHKDICKWEKGHKQLLKDIQRADPQFKRTKNIRKFYKQLEKDFRARWEKEQSNDNTN